MATLTKQQPRKIIPPGRLTLAVLVMASLLLRSAAAERLVIVSDTDVEVSGPLLEYRPPGDRGWGPFKRAVEAWVHPVWSWQTDPDGAKWISNSYLVGPDGGPPSVDSWRRFHREFDIPAMAENTSATLIVNADNAEETYLNGRLIGANGQVRARNIDDSSWMYIRAYAVRPTEGTNRLDFIVKNSGGYPSPENNPTGLIFKLVVTYDLPFGPYGKTRPLSLSLTLIEAEPGPLEQSLLHWLPTHDAPAANHAIPGDRPDIDPSVLFLDAPSTDIVRSLVRRGDVEVLMSEHAAMKPGEPSRFELREAARGKSLRWEFLLHIVDRKQGILEVKMNYGAKSDSERRPAFAGRARRATPKPTADERDWKTAFLLRSGKTAILALDAPPAKERSTKQLALISPILRIPPRPLVPSRPPWAEPPAPQPDFRVYPTPIIHGPFYFSNAIPDIFIEGIEPNPANGAASPLFVAPDSPNLRGLEKQTPVPTPPAWKLYR